MTGALKGIRVLDLSRVLAGPFCSMMLGDLGADVIKVERPGSGDETRNWGPPFVAPGLSAYFAAINRNKRSITVDLRHPDGRQVIGDLAAASDVLIENFTPGTMDSFGLGYRELRALQERLVYCSISGFGADGPYRDRPGYDLTVSALGGLMGITGEREGRPVKVGVAITDVCTGLAAQGAICAALVSRERSGLGQQVQLSLLETQVAALVNIASSFLVSGAEPQRWGTAHETIVPYQAFETADKPIVVAVGNDEAWLRLCQALGRPELAEDARYGSNPLRVENRESCVAAVQAVLSQRPRDHWLERLVAADVACAPVNALSEVFSDRQVLHRDMVVEMPRPAGGRYRAVGIPVKYSDTPALVRRPPPRLGEHTEEVLAEVVGYSRERIARLRDLQVL